MLGASVDAMPSMKVVSAGDGVPVVKGNKKCTTGVSNASINIRLTDQHRCPGE